MPFLACLSVDFPLAPLTLLSRTVADSFCRGNFLIGVQTLPWYAQQVLMYG
jgi:hypothetical protein